MRRKPTTNRHTVRLTGQQARGARITGSVLGELTDLLLDATRGTLRQRVEGRSTARGSVPSWLLSAGDFDVVGIEAGSTLLVIEAPSLAGATPSLFRQQELFEPIDADDSVFGIMEQTLRAAVDGRANSDLFDLPLLSTFRRFEHILAAGFSSVELTSGREDQARVVIDREAIASIDRLILNTPAPQSTRVSGFLDMIQPGDRMFTLLMESGAVVRGIAEGRAVGQLAELSGQRVVVSGTAVFRPSKSLMRIEANAIEPAGTDAAVWAYVPSPLFAVMDAASLRQPQGPRSGVNAILGRWPGDESEEEIVVALRNLS
jgi:hypothetical protein